MSGDQAAAVRGDGDGGDGDGDRGTRRGPLAWMASNAVAANLVMLVFLVGGLIFAGTVRQEVFPEVDLDVVTVTVPYPGASPEEVEQGVVLAIEEEVRGLDGVEEVRSMAREGMAVVTAELFLGADADRVLSDVKSAVDRVTSFPEEIERPVVTLATNRAEVLSLVLHGEVGRRDLDRLAEALRAKLLRDERIVQVEIGGLPDPEISIEVPQESLRRYGLTRGEIARRVRAASLDAGAGGVETPGGEVLLRVKERRDRADELAELIVISGPDGTEVRLGELARIDDGFREGVEREAFYDGRPAARLRVFRVGEASPLAVAEAAHAVAERFRPELPPGIGLDVIEDTSRIYRDRIGLLIRNGRLGILLVLVVLGLFLHPRLAFWVTLGLPVSFLGAFLFMPLFDVSINMISLFAFLLVLGIVVDDAIVVGEAIFAERQRGTPPLAATIDGTREVLRPVIFAVLTTIVAFVPMLFVPGVSGKFFDNIPLIVIPILAISLVESLIVLPAHLAHIPAGAEDRHGRFTGWLTRRQRRFAQGLERWIDRRWEPIVRRLLRRRYLTLAVAVGLLVVTVGLVAGRRLPFDFMPRIEGDTVRASLELPFGAPIATTRQAVERLTAAAQEIGEEAGDEGDGDLVRGIYAEIGTLSAGADLGSLDAGGAGGGGHLAAVDVYLAPGDEREIGAAEVARRWRRRVGEVAGAERLAFAFDEGPAAGADITLELRHADVDVLERTAGRLAEELASYRGVIDVDDGFQLGKPQLDLELRPAARALGLEAADLAAQVRGAFFGAEALRLQRGRDELRIYVRRPPSETDSLADVEGLIVRTPEGGEIPLDQAAHVRRGRSFTEIERLDGGRVVAVTADVDRQVTSANRIATDLRREVLPRLERDVPGLSWSTGGEQESQRESMAALGRGMAVALLVMYALMAIVFRSYLQPLIVLLAIPFGLVSAVGGHLLLGYGLSLISLLGLVALSGVVVNDSLVVVDAVNRYRRDGELALAEAVVAASKRRFRPVLLTSLTTFFGLAPMIFETSLQARFLIPMAISLGFGVLFVTVIALVLVPCVYVAIEDAQRLGRRLRRQLGADATERRESAGTPAVRYPRGP